MANQYVNTKRKRGLDAQLLRALREEKGLSQHQLAQKRGVSEGLISHLETGRRPFREVSLDSLAACMGYSEAEVERRRRRLEMQLLERESRELEDVDPADASLARRCAAAFGLRAARSFEAMLDQAFSKEDVRRERREAERAFRRLIRLDAADRRVLVETHPEYQTLGLVEQLGLASEREAGRDPRSAAALAQLAVFAADRLLAPEAVRSRAQGFAWVFAANTLRVEGKLSKADRAFERASRLWHAGSAGDGLVLEEWRLLDRKASLRRDQRLWRETLDLSDRALVQAPTAARGRILVNKATALEQMGEAGLALQALDEALPFVDAITDRETLLAVRFNRSVCLVHLGRLSEARPEAEAARRLAIEEGKELHVQRCLWVSARIKGEAGDRPEAIAALAQVRRDFTARQLPLEAADVALDEALYLLMAGEARKVAVLTEEIAWIFASEGLTKDALKALRLFYDAAHQRVVTTELVRQVRTRLRASG